MTPEELLKPRYKVIALWINSSVNIGDILSPFTGIGYKNVFTLRGYGAIEESELTKYPHLLRKLEWWEERKVNELPKYLKHKNTSGVYEVKDWFINGCFTKKTDSFVEQASYHLPVTYEEYINYQNKSK